QKDRKAQYYVFFNGSHSSWTHIPGNQSNKERVAKGLTFGKLRRSLSEHDEEQKKLNQGEASLKDVLEAIPQFVWASGRRCRGKLTNVRC
ncbi:hypothetical protein PF010_g31747, partial [Phytophthora fragariae]